VLTVSPLKAKLVERCADMSNIEEMKQAAKDAKDAPKVEKAYNDALTSTVPAPKPETKTPPAKPKKMAKGGMTRADGCITKGHTRGKMV
jgi:hypothetical protein